MTATMSPLARPAVCDTCGTPMSDAPTRAEARRTAKRLGWLCDRYMRCVDCRRHRPNGSDRIGRHLGVEVPNGLYEALLARAVRRHTTLSELVRRLLAQGLGIAGEDEADVPAFDVLVVEPDGASADEIRAVTGMSTDAALADVARLVAQRLAEPTGEHVWRLTHAGRRLAAAIAASDRGAAA